GTLALASLQARVACTEAVARCKRALPLDARIIEQGTAGVAACRAGNGIVQQAQRERLVDIVGLQRRDQCMRAHALAPWRRATAGRAGHRPGSAAGEGGLAPGEEGAG